VWDFIDLIACCVALWCDTNSCVQIAYVRSCGGRNIRQALVAGGPTTAVSGRTSCERRRDTATRLLDSTTDAAVDILNGRGTLLWPPCVADADIIFLPCGFFFYLSFFPSHNLGRRRLDVCHTSTQSWCDLSANLRCRSDTWCTRLTENTGRKNSPKIAIWAPSHNSVGLYLRNLGSYR